MGKISERVQNALDESRILVLGMQILAGFAFQSFLRPGFEHLSRTVQIGKLASLGLVVLSLLLTMAPCSHHRLVERGRDTGRMLRFTSAITGVALLPFALSLGIEVFAAVGVTLPGMAAIGAGAGITAGALGAWYLPGLARSSGKRSDEVEDDMGQAPKLNERIRQVLTELRVVLPGAQALLGFQLAAVLQDGFERLPFASRCVHLAGLGMVAIATILLMVPAAFHRIALRGTESPRLVSLASTMLLSALAALALGFAADIGIVAAKVLHSTRGGIYAGALAALTASALWFGWALLRRASSPRHGTEGEQATAG